MAKRFALVYHALLTWHQTSIVDIQPLTDQWQLTDNQGIDFRVDELAIATGHQPTQVDDQLAQWLTFAQS